MQSPFHYQINLHWNSNFMTGSTEMAVHLLFDFSGFLLLLSVKIQFLVYQLMLPASVQLKGCSSHTALSHQFLVEIETLLWRFLWCPTAIIMTKHWDAFCGGKKSKLSPTFEKMYQNRYLHVIFIVISSAELILQGQMRLYSTWAFSDLMAC